MNRVCSGPGPACSLSQQPRTSFPQHPQGSTTLGLQEFWLRLTTAPQPPPRSSSTFQTPNGPTQHPEATAPLEARRFPGVPRPSTATAATPPSASPALPHCLCPPGRPALQPSPWEPGHFQESTSSLASRPGHAVSSARNSLYTSPGSSNPVQRPPPGSPLTLPDRVGVSSNTYPPRALITPQVLPAPPSEAAKVWGP